MMRFRHPIEGQESLDTTGIVIPQLIANFLAMAAGPAHNQIMSIASARDIAAFQQDRMISLRIAELRTIVRSGRCDHLDILGRLRVALEITTLLTEPPIGSPPKPSTTSRSA